MARGWLPSASCFRRPGERQTRQAAEKRLNPSETLSTIAELALGLAGFTGVLVVLGRQPGRFSPAEGFRLAVLLVASLSALFLSLVPLSCTTSASLGHRCGASRVA